MDNLKAIEAWTAWVEENDDFPGDVTPADSPSVDFWFANNGESANESFHCFANGGDGSLLAVHSKSGDFASGPVVHLGHEGEVFVIAKDVPSALALVATSGSSYEQAIYGDDDLEVDAAFAKWLAETFGVEPPKSVAKAVKAVDAELGDAVRAAVEALNDA